MNTPEQIAKHFREIYFGTNWTCSNIKEHLADITWQQATTKVYSFNTIAILICHIHYYVKAVTTVLEGGVLEAKDELSFGHPPIHSQEEWDALLNTIWQEAEKFAQLIALLPEDKLWQDISLPKYGIYYRNLHGIIEHANYHLGQIVLIKKILQETKQDAQAQ